MFKNLNRKYSIGIVLNRIYLTLSLLLIGTCSSVFAIDLSQAFSQAIEQSAGIDTIFKGKSTVSNLYSKALQLAKDKEVTATMFSFDQLKLYFTTCTRLETIDFINILYHSHFSFRNTFDQIFPVGTKHPSTAQIDSSYAKFFACRNIEKPTSADIQNLNNEIHLVYTDIYTNTYTMSTLNKSNFGSDLFWNGTLDDSDFDLLYDINQIGKILFDDIAESPEILFYRLPTSPSSQNDNGSSSSNQGATQLGGGGGSFPGTSGSPSSSTLPFVGGGTSSSLSMTSASAQSSSQGSQDSFLIADTEVQNFIATTNSILPTSSLVGTTPLVFGNQCLISDTPAPVVEEETPLMTPEEYMSGIDTFIEHANIDDVINARLLAEFATTSPLASGASSSDSGYADSVANFYAEQALGDAASGSCEYACKDLPLDKQVQCELACSKSCIQKCDGMGLQDKLLCISDCTCFLIAGPNGAGWEKMEDMFRIKFCKVPVQTKRVVPGKTVFSIQAIFQEISDVLEGLRDSGQMVKFSKRKEFLDGNIKIKFADNFAFKLQVGFKPVFPQKSTTIKRQEQTQANMDLNIAVLDMNASAPEADNYNKYIVISDPISDNASLEPANSLSEINENIQKFTTAANAAKAAKLSAASITAVTTSYAQSTKVLFVQNMIDFLRDNQSFLNNLTFALLDINKMSLEFKTKIENSN
ncbi:MAG TPA: hypothetical protein PKC87_01155 [Candidatus Absconditabacterales bacterium]|nr:hypothetical protein [Candidatus Absconditabacterales bacterium]